MSYDGGIIDFDNEFRNLSNESIERLIDLKWNEHQKRRANPTGISAKIIEDLEDWYEGDDERKEFLYQKVIQLNEVAEGFEDEEQRIAFIEILKREINGETESKVKIQVQKKVLPIPRPANKRAVREIIKSLGIAELQTYEGVIQQLGGKESAKLTLSGEGVVSRAQFYDTLKKLKGAGLIKHFRRLNGSEVDIEVQMETVEEAIPEIKKLTSS